MSKQCQKRLQVKPKVCPETGSWHRTKQEVGGGLHRKLAEDSWWRWWEGWGGQEGEGACIDRGSVV